MIQKYLKWSDIKFAAIAIILNCLGLYVRIFYMLKYPLDKSLYSDMSNYVESADEVARNFFESDQFFQPAGYSFFLALLKTKTQDWMYWLHWSHLFASQMAIVLVWIAATWSFGRKIGLFVLAICALHFPWLNMAALTLPETLFTFLMAALCLLSIRLINRFSILDAFAWAVLFDLALFLKGTHIFIVVLFSLGLLVFNWRKAIKPLVVMGIVISSWFVGHGLYTQKKIGVFQMNPTAGGLNFIEGKCPLKKNKDSLGREWLSPLYAQLGKEDGNTWEHPFEESSYFFKQGLKCIQEHPLVLAQSFEAILYLFMGNWMWPEANQGNPDWSRIYQMIFSIYSFVGLFAFLCIAPWTREYLKIILPWAMPILSLFLCVYIFKSEYRYRIPFDVWILPLATKGWGDLLRARIALARVSD